jgi:hypothetical protein
MINILLTLGKLDPKKMLEKIGLRLCQNKNRIFDYISTNYATFLDFLSCTERLFWLDYNEVASFVMKLFGFTENDFYLSLDRTNWKWGKININLLVLAVVYKGAATFLDFLSCTERLFKICPIIFFLRPTTRVNA